MPALSGLKTTRLPLKAFYKKYDLQFKRPSGTSRGVLTFKETWFVVLEDQGKYGIGECGLLRGLSIDDRPDYEQTLQWVCNNIYLGFDELYDSLVEFPSIQFGLETAFLSIAAKSTFLLFPSKFTSGEKNIPINGLVWMGDPEFMKSQIDEKLATGFNCIKIKIGALDFQKEIEILSYIRQLYGADQIEIRVDANGGFTSAEALDKLTQLSEFEIHSIEQPIEINQHDSMSQLCKSSAIPIALDEELIGVFAMAEKEALIEKIRPQYIILKPSLIGGFKGAAEWIAIADQYNVSWWITSALESDIGLNAIAQWTFTLNSKLPQGLGTGSLYTNNVQSPLVVKNGELQYSPDQKWSLKNVFDEDYFGRPIQ